ASIPRERRAPRASSSALGRAEEETQRRGEPGGALDEASAVQGDARAALVRLVRDVEVDGDLGGAGARLHAQALAYTLVAKPEDDCVQASRIALAEVGETGLVADDLDLATVDGTAPRVLDVAEDRVAVVDLVLGPRRIGDEDDAEERHARDGHPPHPAPVDSSHPATTRGRRGGARRRRPSRPRAARPTTPPRCAGPGDTRPVAPARRRAPRRRPGDPSAARPQGSGSHGRGFRRARSARRRAAP